MVSKHDPAYVEVLALYWVCHVMGDVVVELVLQWDVLELVELTLG